jgi:D-alanine-D-alanine ligase
LSKLRVGIIFGGRSGEHEVSLASAASIFKHLDPRKYDAVPIRIDKSGRWQLAGAVPTAISAADVIKQAQTEALAAVEPSAAVASGVDVIFPVLHGPYGEDGTVQGLLELADLPYVGSGVRRRRAAVRALARVPPWPRPRRARGTGRGRPRLPVLREAGQPWLVGRGVEGQ